MAGGKNEGRRTILIAFTESVLVTSVFGSARMARLSVSLISDSLMGVSWPLLNLTNSVLGVIVTVYVLDCISERPSLLGERILSSIVLPERERIIPVRVFETSKISILVAV